MLELVGLPQSKEQYPAELSGGMKKRVGLARAIANRPEIVLYDEPTAGLDPIMSNNISRLIRKTQQQLQVTSVLSNLLIWNQLFMRRTGLLCFIREKLSLWALSKK